MIRAYDKTEIAEIWANYTEGCECEYPLTEDHIDEITDLIEQSRYEVAKGRMEKPLTIEEAVQIVCDAQ